MLWIHNTQWKASEKQSARFQVQILGIRFSWSQTIKQRTGLNASCHTQRHQNRLSRKSQPQHGSPSASKSASSLWVSLPLTTEYPDIVVVHYRCCIGHLAYCSLTKLLDDSVSSFIYCHLGFIINSDHLSFSGFHKNRFLVDDSQTCHSRTISNQWWSFYSTEEGSYSIILTYMYTYTAYLVDSKHGLQHPLLPIKPSRQPVKLPRSTPNSSLDKSVHCFHHANRRVYPLGFSTIWHEFFCLTN